MNILFVCTGNTCRSPMAEALLKHKKPKSNVQSAGIFAGHNQRATENTIKALNKRHIPIDHKTKPVTGDLLFWADIVLTMTAKHKQSLMLDFPNYQDKYFTLKEYVSDADKKVWEELKTAYAELEEKKLQMSQQKGKQNSEMLKVQLQDDLAYIRSLESNLISYDVTDPFGGDLKVYEKTLEELNENIDMLIEKIKS